MIKKTLLTAILLGSVTQAALNMDDLVPMRSVNGQSLVELSLHRASVGCELSDDDKLEVGAGYAMQVGASGQLYARKMNISGDLGGNIRSIQRRVLPQDRKNFIILSKSCSKVRNACLWGGTIDLNSKQGQFQNAVFSFEESLSITGNSLSFNNVFCEVDCGQNKQLNQTVVRLLPRKDSIFYLELTPVHPIVWLQGSIGFKERKINLNVVGADVTVIFDACRSK